MIRYLVSARYTAGPNEGRQFLLMKGGYVVGDSKPFLSETYATEAAAQAVGHPKEPAERFRFFPVQLYHSLLLLCFGDQLLMEA